MTTPVLDRDATDEAVRELAEAGYYAPAAAALLVPAAASPVRSEERFRAQAALRALAYAQDLDALPGDPNPPRWARAIGSACTELATYLGLGHGVDRHERERVARLLSALCREAERLRRLREAEAA